MLLKFYLFNMLVQSNGNDDNNEKIIIYLQLNR